MNLSDLNMDYGNELEERRKDPLFNAMWTTAYQWATQPTDYDDDTEQQIHDGWVIMLILSAPDPMIAAQMDLTEMVHKARRASVAVHAEVERMRREASDG